MTSNVTIKHKMTRAEINTALDKAEFEGRSIELILGPAKEVGRALYWSRDSLVFATVAAECKHYHDIKAIPSAVTPELPALTMCRDCLMIARKAIITSIPTS